MRFILQMRARSQARELEIRNRSSTGGGVKLSGELKERLRDVARASPESSSSLLNLATLFLLFLLRAALRTSFGCSSMVLVGTRMNFSGHSAM